MENELSIKVSANLQEAIKSLDKIIPKLNQFDNSISKVLNSIDKNNSVNKISNELGKLGNEMDKISKKGDNFKNALSLGATYMIAKKVINTGLSWMQKSIDYSEALNLFNVVLDESIDKGMKFQNVMNEAFGTNQAETLTRQGLYQSMAENMGIAQEYAYIMSETSTKLVNDISSLYNKDENTVAEALRAGVFAGQTKPLRSFGMDITENSLQPLLNELNITNEDGTVKTVRQLSQAEKQIVRYIAVLRQSSEAHGDWANTIEAPANQLKIFKNQLVEAQRALANLFINSFGQILPYANAILMVVKEVANAIGAFLGIEITDYNSGVISTLGDDFEDLGANVDDATGKVKELKKQTLGFDQINNIDTKKDSSNGTSGIGTIDQRLLDAIGTYDNGMEKVRMKAIEIRDAIMKWLGFTKEIDPLTGKVSFKYKGITTTLKNIWESFNNLSTTGKILTTLGLVAGATKLYNVGKKIFTLLGGSGLVKTTSSLVSPLKSVYDYTKLYTNLAGGAGLTGIKKLTAGVSEGVTAWGKQLTAIDKLKVALIGSGGLLVSLGYMNEAMYDIAENGVTWSNSLQTIASGMGSIASGAMIGTSILPGWGTLIGACAGGVISLVTAMNGIDTAMNTNMISIEKTGKKVKSLYEDWQESEGRIQNIISSSTAESTYHKNLLKELENIVDENGYIKQGYEDRANTITTILSEALGIEIKIVDGQIQKYDELKNKIDEVIEKKKAQARLTVLEKEATDAINKKTEAENNMITTTNDLSDAEDNYRKKLKSTGSYTDELIDSLILLKKGKSNLKTEAEKLGISEKRLRIYLEDTIVYANKQNKALDKAISNYYTAEETLRGYNSTIYAWEKATEYSVNENYDALNFFFDHEKELLGKSEQEQKTYWETVKTNNKTSLAELEKNRDKYGEELYNKLKKQYTEQIVLADDEMNKLKLVMDTKNGKISDSTIETWKKIGEESEEKFLSYLKLLPSNLQTQVVDKMKEKGFKVSDELQKGIDQLKPTVDVKVNTSNVKNGIDKIKELLQFGFGGSLTGGGGFRANGGIYANGKWHEINQYANGGTPTSGEMFIARERGPELVGSIGRKTAVLNNGQIVESVSAGVYGAVLSAMSQIPSNTQDIRVYAEEGIIVEKAVRGIQDYVTQTGELPFSVPI